MDMFGLLKKRVYLDHAAATMPSKAALAAYKKASVLFGNPDSLHDEGVRAKKALEAARQEVASALSIRPRGVIFTSGATEANNLGILGYIELQLASGKEAGQLHVLYHEGAHSSIIAAVGELSRRGVSVEGIALEKGIPDLGKLSAQLSTKTALVILELVEGGTGAVMPVRDVRRVLDAYNKQHGGHIMLLVDASQAPRVASVSLTSLGADMLTLDAQKIGGVRGAGVLALTHRADLRPVMFGGGQQRGLRPGTENPALACAFATALKESQDGREAFVARARLLQEELMKTVTRISEAVLLASSRQAPHINTITLRGRDTDYLLFLLDKKGFAVSTRSACESDAEASRMVELITGEKAQARSTLRVSFGPHTSLAQVRRFGSALEEAVRFFDANKLE